MERLDKLFSSCGILTRSNCQTAVRKKQIMVNGVVATSTSQKVDYEKDIITYLGKVPDFRKFSYIMLNKPSGVVSSTEDGDTTVIDILPSEYKREGLFPCGRLDKDTVGLVIITNDGVSAHKRLSPNKHAEKVYEFTLIEEYSNEDILEIEKGVTLKDGYITKPCKIERISKTQGKITLTEGKYHEIKRIFASRGNKVIFLKRISFAGITLDETLKDGECRYLNKEEEKLFTK